MCIVYSVISYGLNLDDNFKWVKKLHKQQYVCVIVKLGFYSVAKLY